MDEPALLRHAAEELRAVAVALGTPTSGPLSHALRLAWNPATWRGPFAENFTIGLRHQAAGLERAAGALVAYAAKLDRLAAERAAASAAGGTLPSAT